MSTSVASVANPAAQAPGSAAAARARDARLVARIAERDAAALAEALNDGFTRVFAVARRMIGNDAEAEDIAQEVFLRLWRKPPDLAQGKASLATWLYRVTANLSIDGLRRKRPQPLEDALEIPAGDPPPDEAAAEAQVSQSVDRALAALPDRQCLALTLTYYQGLSNIEAAEVMEISVDALESLLARARRGVRRELEDGWRDLLEAIEFS